MRNIKRLLSLSNKQVKKEKMTRLESTKAINNLKFKAIKKGGYLKFKNEILKACNLHLELFGNDLTPKQLI